MIRWVIDLEKAGQADKAAALFNEGFEAVGRVSEKHPHSALKYLPPRKFREKQALIN